LLENKILSVIKECEGIFNRVCAANSPECLSFVQKYIFYTNLAVGKILRK